MKFLAPCGLLLAATLLAHAQDPYANSVVSYLSGTGSGFNTGYENSSVALGAPASSATITAPAYSNSQIVGVGEGGELTVEFDTPIANDPADHAGGMDFTIFGNQFFVLGSNGITGIYDHTGLTVWVSQDDVTFYQLVAPDGLPHGADDLFPTNGGGNPFLPLSPSLSLSSFVGQTSAEALSLYNGSAGGSSDSISWAENANGDPVDLSSISYIKVEGSTGYGYIDGFARVESVPEASNLVFLLMGGAGLLCLRRSKRVRLFFPGPTRRWAKGPEVFLSLGAVLLFFAGAGARAATFGLSDIQYWVGSGTNQSALVISWNDGITPDSLVFGYKWDALASGGAPTVYDMMEALQSADSLLSFTANPLYNDPATGDYALYSAFYDLTGQGGPVVGLPYNLGGTENGHAPAGDHYKEGWYTGFWGEVLGTGDPYDGGSWDSFSGEGLAVDTLSDDGWFGLSFSTDETNFTVPDPGFPTADFPVAVPEPAGALLLSMSAAGLFAFRRHRRRRMEPP